MPDRKRMINELTFQLNSKDVKEYHHAIQLSVTDAEKILTLLKAQGPRLMTLEEVRIAEEAVEPFWCEFADHYLGSWRMGFRIRTEGKEVQHSVENYFERAIVWESSYGSSWRCWTARPTDEQRKEVKWDD